MKRRILLTAMLLVAAGLQSVSAQTAMKVWRGSNFEIYRTSEVDSVQFVKLVSEIQLSQTSVELEKGETLQLTATVLPEDADEKSVTWQSNIPSIASVDETGLLTAMHVGSCIVTCSATDGSGVKATCQVTVTSSTTPEPDPGNHEWVDLGLPSGTLWATCNVGASSPEEYGDYFAWGETTSKDVYNMDTYFDSDYNKYYINGLTELFSEDDAATVNWGSGWQMPSLDQIKELINSEYTTIEWTTQGDVSGGLITSKSNGNIIFLPAGGYRNDTSLPTTGSNGWYWSRTFYTDYSSYAFGLYFNYTSYFSPGFDDRYFGRNVRPVRVAK